MPILFAEVGAWARAWTSSKGRRRIVEASFNVQFASVQLIAISPGRSGGRGRGPVRSRQPASAVKKPSRQVGPFFCTISDA
jgi:hypothetical protein